MEHVPGFQKLLARARAEDRAATDELLTLVRPWLEQLARGHAPDGCVSDLVPEAWLRAWQKLGQFQGADDEAQAQAMFRAWLARIVTRLGLNAARDSGARQRTAPGKLLRPDGPGAAAGDSAAVPDPLDRDVVRLRFFEGMSLRRVAARLGCNHETVRQRYHAVLHRLQRDLDGLA